MILKGSAGFKYTDTNEITVPLAAPLHIVNAVQEKTRYTRRALDKSVAPDVTTIGSGAWLVVGRIRYAADPLAVLRMLEFAADGGTLNYYPSLNVPGESYAMRVTGFGDEIDLGLDGSFGHFRKAYERSVRLTATTGNLEPIMSGVLFRYTPGRYRGDASYSRASAASYRNRTGVGTYPLTAAISGALRDGHWTRNPHTGVYERSTRLEGARTNLHGVPEEFDNVAWTKVESTVTANALVAPDGTTTMDKVVESVANGAHYVRGQPTLADSTNYVSSIHVKVGERTQVFIFTVSKAGTGNTSVFDLSTGTIVTTAAGHTARIEALPEGGYRCSVMWNSGAGGTTPTVSFGPASGNSSTYAGNGTSGIYIWGAQTEAGMTPSSYNNSAALARAADSIYFPFAIPPQSLTLYGRYIERGTYRASGTVLSITDAAASSSWRIRSNSSSFRLNAGSSESIRTGGASYGDLVEFLGTIAESGAANLSVVVNGVQTDGTAGVASAIPAAFAAQRLYLNSNGGSNVGFADFLEVKIARRVRTLSAMRSL